MSSSPLKVFVPKSAVTDSKSRNSLSGLLATAGYDRLSNVGLDRQDACEQGGIRFVGIKDASTLSEQMRRLQGSAGVIMGTDVLVEADLMARVRGYRVEIQRVLDLGIGRCDFRILAPDERLVSDALDLEGHTIFTKFPYTAKRMMETLGQRVMIEQVTGAEIRANEARTLPVAAFEIVQSGQSARENRLVVPPGFPYPTSDQLDISYAEFPKVATDLFSLNVSAITSRARDAFLELGLALESAMSSNEFTVFRFNVPTDRVALFANFGMRGPTVSQVIAKDGASWSALEISVSRASTNAVRRELVALNAKDILTEQGAQAEPDPTTSQVLAALNSDMLAETRDFQNPESLSLTSAAELLTSIDQHIALRIQSADPASGTIKALLKGVEFCASKCAEEVLEFTTALVDGNSADAKEEGADLLYRFLVVLHSISMSFQQLYENGEIAFRSVPYSFLDPSQLILNVQRAWNECSTAIRKSSRDEIVPLVQAYMDALTSLLRGYSLSLKELVLILQNRARPVHPQ
jgi:phosphoribosyl-ATP pyrophosphohydrolase